MDVAGGTMRTLEELKTTVKLCMFDLYGTIVDMQ